MSLLKVDQAKAKSLLDVEKDALEIIKEVLQGKRDYGDDAEFALKVAKNTTTNRQTENSNAALLFNIVCSITDDSEVKRKFLEEYQPSLKKLSPGRRKTA